MSRAVRGRSGECRTDLVLLRPETSKNFSIDRHIIVRLV